MFRLYSKFDPIFNFLEGKYQDKPFTIWHETFPNSIEQLNENPYNFLIIAEPNEFFGLHNVAIANYNLFTAVLTWSDFILKNCPNGIRFTFNGRILDDAYLKSIENKPKQFETSFLSGNKNLVEGHHLRQRIRSLENEVLFPKKWFSR
jgi:hypothetical protein